MVAKCVGINKGKLQPRPDKGKLPGHVPEPQFVADPNHCGKTLNGELIKMDTAGVKVRETMTRMDTLRITKNFGAMARTLRNRPQCEFIPAANAVLEHHFDVHDHCGDWCPRKQQTEAQRLATKKYYRNKETDAKLYVHLKEKFARFVTMDKLEEIAHDMDTNMNEGFNNICTWFAPNNKVYAGTVSLPNRIALAVCINSMGVMPFYTKLFHRLGITMTENVDHYLQVKETQRMKQIERGKSKEGKKKRSQMKYDRLKQATVTTKMERHKRAGTYRKGMNMDDPYGELLNGKEVDERKTAAKRKAPSALGLFCEWCGSNDHRTKRPQEMHGPTRGSQKIPP
jgi:hypothetical protein